MKRLDILADRLLKRGHPDLAREITVTAESPSVHPFLQSEHDRLEKRFIPQHEWHWAMRDYEFMSRELIKVFKKAITDIESGKFTAEPGTVDSLGQSIKNRQKIIKMLDKVENEIETLSRG